MAIILNATNDGDRIELRVMHFSGHGDWTTNRDRPTFTLYPLQECYKLWRWGTQMIKVFSKIKMNALAINVIWIEAQLNCIGRVFLQHTSAWAHIGIKRMGELDIIAFKNAVKQKSPEEAAILCSKWEAEITKPEWHPFMIVMVDGKEMEVIREDDAKLVELKEELGEEIYTTW
uniref:OSJNBa0019J05.23 protein n=1 Tax=Oryza sativa subsp. japonica TaxID=39947 RepID=Q7XW71_ORYSJ|nr:OSJNBa0019J05.23 [Oryza sativa Japonica Group]CAE04073.1 OSJNBb0032D24.3 [Oryza sativa Japonica Group]